MSEAVNQFLGGSLESHSGVPAGQCTGEEKQSERLQFSGINLLPVFFKFGDVLFETLNDSSDFNSAYVSMNFSTVAALQAQGSGLVISLTPNPALYYSTQEEGATSC